MDGQGIDDFFILGHKVQMDRFRKNRVLGAEGDDGSG